MQKRGVFHQISKHVTVHDFLSLWLLNLMSLISLFPTSLVISRTVQLFFFHYYFKDLLTKEQDTGH